MKILTAMGPKKTKPSKGGKKGDKKGDKDRAEPTEWDDLPLEELESAVVGLGSDLDNGRGERARAQAEHDAVQSYQTVTQNRAREVELLIAALDRRIEDLLEDNAVELRVYAHKVKHIDYEHKRKIGEVKVARESSLTEERESHDRRRGRLEGEKESALRGLREEEAAASKKVEQARVSLGEELGRKRGRLESDLGGFRSRCDEHLAEMRSDLELASRSELREAEERADLHLSVLERRHREAYEDSKAYFGSIVKEGLEEIQKFRCDIDRIKGAEERSLARTDELTEENNRLVGPLKETSALVSKMRHKIRDKDKDAVSLKSTRSRLKVAEDRLKRLVDEYGVLKGNFDEVESERNALRIKLEQIYNSTVKFKEDKFHIESVI